MNLTKLNPLAVLTVVLALSAAGCKTRHPEGVTPLPGITGTNVADTGAGPLGGNEKPLDTNVPGGPIAQNNIDRHDWIQNREALQADTVHFDYDSSVVKSSEKSKVEAVAGYMKANPGTALRIEGHCDERGTDEYNRALGERRALALREEIVRMGVEADRVETISYGRDRPVDTGHSEASHRKNRRGEFVVLTPPGTK